MEAKEKVTEKIPTWALSCIVNNDSTGLEDNEIRLIEDWFSISGYDYVTCPSEYNVYFSNRPAFGLPSDVVDCVCIKL